MLATAAALSLLLAGADSAAAPPVPAPAAPAPAAPAQAAPAPGAPEAGAPDADDRPPPGAPEDQALWRAGRKASVDVVVVRAEAGRLQSTVRAHKLLERLEAAERAERAAGRDHERLEELGEALLEAWKRNYEVFGRQWPVDPTRGCGYPLLELESTMPLADDPARAGDLRGARGALRECVSRAGLAVEVMQAENRALAARIAAAREALAAHERAAVAPAGAPAGGK